MLLIVVFFFSSRRRHTRSTRDWSSDVCSSDLGHRQAALGAGPTQLSTRRRTVHENTTSATGVWAVLLLVTAMLLWPGSALAVIGTLTDDTFIINPGTANTINKGAANDIEVKDNEIALLKWDL